jgi:hypothetical protein
VRQAGRIRAAAQGTEVKDHGQVPAEPGGQVQPATRKTLRGEGTPGSAFSTPSCRIEGVVAADIYAPLRILTHALRALRATAV